MNHLAVHQLSIVLFDLLFCDCFFFHVRTRLVVFLLFIVRWQSISVVMTLDKCFIIKYLVQLILQSVFIVRTYNNETITSIEITLIGLSIFGSIASITRKLIKLDSGARGASKPNWTCKSCIVQNVALVVVVIFQKMTITTITTRMMVQLQTSRILMQIRY